MTTKRTILSAQIEPENCVNIYMQFSEELESALQGAGFTKLELPYTSTLYFIYDISRALDELVELEPLYTEERYLRLLLNQAANEYKGALSVLVSFYNA